MLRYIAITRIPVLTLLGARLDDKLDVQVFQRHRRDGDNAWTWPSDTLQIDFETVILKDGQKAGPVALVLSLSGTEIQVTRTSAALCRTPPCTRFDQFRSKGCRGVISSPQDLARFEDELRHFLALVEREHGKIANLDVFPSIGVAAAVTLGRVLMPDVTPSLTLWDHDADMRTFFRALEVSA